MMLPCFKCENCDTNWVVDIYSKSKEGISQKFISTSCCPICGKRNLRVCFIYKVENEITNNINESLNFFDEVSATYV
ncbi:MAG: hypothetical protein ACTSR3_20985 [Candidatus Helarchaeota archaeon]